MFNFQVLAKVLSKLVELSPIPQLFMLVRDRTPSSAPPLLWLFGAERRVACRSCRRRQSIGLRTDSRCMVAVDASMFCADPDSLEQGMPTAGSHGGAPDFEAMRRCAPLSLPACAWSEWYVAPTDPACPDPSSADKKIWSGTASGAAGAEARSVRLLWKGWLRCVRECVRENRVIAILRGLPQPQLRRALRDGGA
jgi:hypothetical protein